MTADNEEVKKESVEEADEKVTQKEEYKLSIMKSNISFSNLTEELKRKFAIPEDKIGVVITNINEEESSFKIGDLITNINQESINDISKLKKLYENSKKSEKQNILLLIERGNTSMFVPLPIM